MLSVALYNRLRGTWGIKIIFGLLLFLLLACSAAFAGIVTSIRPLAFIAAAVADGVTTVEVLLPEMASPHYYNLRPSDLQRLHRADLVVWVGPQLEGFLHKPLQTIISSQLMLSRLESIRPLLRVNGKVSAMHCGGQSKHDKPGDHCSSSCCTSHNDYDLHIWLSPEVARQIAREIGHRLIQLFPQHCQHIKKNLDYFEHQLQQLEIYISQQLKPLSHRPYFVFHQAYSYFESYFGLHQRGHFTVNPSIAPGAKKLQQIRQQLQQLEKICVFTEPQFQPAIIHRIARGTSAKLGQLDPLGTQVPITRDSYLHFLGQLAQQFTACLAE